ncbi:hypothetical protein M434DRAFT_393801 [Hypoxylon sp. CO27-5]|nr:hypothetical protein M434DRAFT_393801 [Hypoxylon sp. CO27-5]
MSGPASDSPALPCHVTPCRVTMPITTYHLRRYVHKIPWYTVQTMVLAYMASYYMRMHCLTDIYR